MNIKIHPLAEVQSQDIGEGTVVWQYAVVLAGARIGRNCNLNCHTLVEGGAELGDEVTVKSGVYVWSGTRIGHRVFLGPNVSFTNDRYPRSKNHSTPFVGATIEDGASLGAAAIVLGGVRVGRYALVAAGALVSRDVPAHALVRGAPARVCGWVDCLGEKLRFDARREARGSDGQRYQLAADGQSVLAIS